MQHQTAQGPAVDGAGLGDAGEPGRHLGTLAVDPVARQEVGRRQDGSDRIIRDNAGGDAASTPAFARRELFDKLGMRHVTLEFDAAGAPIGSSHMPASARDWARFGLLYRNDGVAGGERLLPPGWVDYSAAPTPGSERFGYAAGFWTNRGDGEGQRYRIARGIPADALFARGANGQYIVVVPSQRLVVVRLGSAFTPRDDMDVVARLVADAIASPRS